MTGFADRVLDGIGPALLERAGDLLPDLVDALTAPAAATDALVQPAGTRRWATVFDLEVTPDPRYLAQFTGTTIPAALDTEQARAYARDRSGWYRGSLPVLAAAVASALPDTARFEIVERDGSPGRISLRILDTTDPVDDQAVLRAAAEEKAIGLRIVGITRDEPLSYADLTAALEDYADLEEQYPTLVDVAQPFPRRWWRPRPTRYARLTAEHTTYADFTAAFPRYSDATEHDPTQEG